MMGEKKIKGAVMPKLKNMVAIATPSATLLLGDKTKEEIRILNEKPVLITFHF